MSARRIFEGETVFVKIYMRTKYLWYEQKKRKRGKVMHHGVL